MPAPFGRGQSWEPVTQPKSLTGSHAGTQLLELSLDASWGHISRKLDVGAELGLGPRHFSTGCGRLNYQTKCSCTHTPYLNEHTGHFWNPPLHPRLPPSPRVSVRLGLYFRMAHLGFSALASRQLHLESSCADCVSVFSVRAARVFFISVCGPRIQPESWPGEPWWTLCRRRQGAQVGRGLALMSAQ